MTWFGGNDIAEQGGKEKSNTDLGIISEDLYQLFTIPAQRDGIPVVVHEVALELIE